MGLNIANCPRCGKIYAKGARDVCPACIKELDNEYEICVKYLRDNKGATIKELSDDTGVSVKQITKFIRDGRISLYNAPNLAYPCEVCGTLVREGSICDNCRQRLTNDVNKAKDEHQQKLEQQALRQSQTYKIDKKN